MRRASATVSSGVVVPQRCIPVSASTSAPRRAPECARAASSASTCAAESTATEPVSYQQMVLAMDVAVKAGFADVGITEPLGLSARPQL